MEWTPERAYAILQEIYTDKLMQDEKRRVFQKVRNQLKQFLKYLAIDDALLPYEARMKLFKDFAFMPGDTIFWSMQYLFNMARGEREADWNETEMHLNRIYQALFTPAGLKKPVIPDSFWNTPLGIACKIAEKGIESVYPILEEIEAERQDD
ncbi:hypothetical protein DCC39_02815 [Pueribacillus theae]|uniref:Uncharacterized protein n=1 Tax=Pueribacillus theae TaxID=2171751 RepID=A0A2U1K6C8_9BACI|nr:hypothetical protein [Pueribacillus theae]PWA13077.1 hypothetical protein DCC39_02815 [Pueribacillus theae]